MHTFGRGDGALRRYRMSVREAAYFLTLCTETRARDLTHDDTATAIRTELSAIESDGHWFQRAGVLMPDHLHLLVRLTGELSIARCVARLKAKTRSVLGARGLTWQPNFYELRLRADDPVEDVVRYIFLNPYRTGETPNNTHYRWFWLGADEDVWFKRGTDDGRPFPEWLR